MQLEPGETQPGDGQQQNLRQINADVQTPVPVPGQVPGLAQMQTGCKTKTGSDGDSNDLPCLGVSAMEFGRELGKGTGPDKATRPDPLQPGVESSAQVAESKAGATTKSWDEMRAGRSDET